MSLKTYQRKRHFDKTPEPEGGQPPHHKELLFVVQKHRASHLHYDFRLELDGVLKSWAVPKGPSLNPKVRRLAMMVEDHPYDYKDFEGIIPKGHYGAGQVIVWDNGTYGPAEQSGSPQAELRRQLAKGHLSFRLKGKKLNGEFALVKTKGAPNAWLLFKKADKFASDKDITEQSDSVISKRTIKQPPKQSVSSIDITDQPKQSLPSNISPMLATLTKEPFNQKDWLFEIKWDGYRALLSKQGSDVNLVSRTGGGFADKYSAIVDAGKRIDNDLVVDGEVVALDEKGEARFEWLQNWQRHPRGSLVYYVFDILWLNGYDLTRLPLSQRKKILVDLLGDSPIIRFSDHILADGEKLFKAAKARGLEGIVAKRTDSQYQKGRRSKDWLKIKTHLRQEVVIGGFTEPRGSRKSLGALILGVYDKAGELRYVGHTGGGIPPSQLKPLRERLDKMTRKTSPFIDKFKPNAPANWVSPKLVCEVSFSQWTSSGHMRQPIFEGLREDKPPMDVRREQPDKQSPKAKDNKLMFTNLDKVFWPKAGYQKSDLLEYYKNIGPQMLPYIKDRPHSLLRQPNGIEGEAFFQKDMDHSPPAWVKTMAIYSKSNHKDINYLVVKDLDSLLYMVQLGCIEINPWNSRAQSLEKPDWCVLDLDPEAIGFDSVIEVAQTIHKLCDKYDIPAYPKTSGKTGVHIFIPLGAKYSYEQSKQFAQLLAGLAHSTTADITSLERQPKNRQKKIYIDFLQNRKGQTLAAPYSVRPTPEATVSTPLKWSEVNKRLRPEKFTIKTIHRRLDKVGDIWEPVVGIGADIKNIIAKMEQ